MAIAAPVSVGRTDRREIDARVGMTFFLASWGMVFLTLFFSAAVLRLRSETWPPLGSRVLPIAVPAINTALLALSSVILRRGVRAMEARESRRLSLSLAATLLLGSLFLGLQAQIWSDLWRSGMRMQDGTYEALFWALTTFHGVHVLAGLGLLLWILPIPRRPQLDVRARIRVRSVAMFWHFVDVAWLATFLVVYVV